MCLSIPMQLVALEDANSDFAIVERRQGNALRRERVNMMPLGSQPLGTCILGTAELAKEGIDDHQRALIEDALAALSDSITGDYDPADRFADLTNRPAGRSDPR